MTSERISDERLAELLKDYCVDHGNWTGAYMSSHAELISILTELQSLRSAREAGPVACSGCGSMRTDEQCRNEQKSCCPERKMIPVADLIAELWGKAYPPPSTEGSMSDDDNAAKWRENVEAMLSTGDPDVIRCHEGGGPESLIGSLVLTMVRTRNARDKALRSAREAK